MNNSHFFILPLWDPRHCSGKHSALLSPHHNAQELPSLHINSSLCDRSCKHNPIPYPGAASASGPMAQPPDTQPSSSPAPRYDPECPKFPQRAGAGRAALAFCSSPVRALSSAPSLSSSCASRFWRKAISVCAQSKRTCHASSANTAPGAPGAAAQG